MRDKYHAMALIAAGAGGLRDDQVAGLAHIFRQIARDENEACAKVAEEQAKYFLSPEYATDQPLSSFNERFACKQVASAIRSRLLPAAAIEAPCAEDVI